MFSCVEMFRLSESVLGDAVWSLRPASLLLYAPLSHPLTEQHKDVKDLTVEHSAAQLREIIWRLRAPQRSAALCTFEWQICGFACNERRLSHITLWPERCPCCRVAGSTIQTATTNTNLVLHDITSKTNKLLIKFTVLMQVLFILCLKHSLNRVKVRRLDIILESRQ